MMWSTKKKILGGKNILKVNATAINTKLRNQKKLTTQMTFIQQEKAFFYKISIFEV